jgi:hypothetical protein
MLTPEQIDRIYDVAASLQLNLDWVVVPMAGSAQPEERVLPDGKILVKAPTGAAFDAWFSGLKERIESLDLSRTARAWTPERFRVKADPAVPPVSGIKKYLPWKK